MLLKQQAYIVANGTDARMVQIWLITSKVMMCIYLEHFGCYSLFCFHGFCCSVSFFLLTVVNG